MHRNYDLFCYLPDSILILILSFLPYKDGGKTATLSKRWRLVCKKWLSTTRVEFNENLFTEENNGEIKLSTRAFLNFARRSVLYYQGRNLYEFRIKMSNPSDYCSDIEGWIKFVIGKNVEVLDLDFSSAEANEDEGSNENADFELPVFLYECISLRVLKLTSCDLNRLDIPNFRALKSLYVARIELSSKSLKVLVWGCPLLKTLSLVKCSGLDYIEISSPNSMHLESLIIEECRPLDAAVSICAGNLRSFKYFGVLTTFDIGDLGSLEEAQLDFRLERYLFEAGDVLCELLRGLYNAKVLSVCSYTIQVLPSGEEEVRLSTPLNIRHLILNTGLQRDELPGIVFLLRSCRLLEAITIEMENSDTSSLGGKLFWASRKNCPITCLRKNLKNIVMKNFKATENAISSVEFLLYKSKALQELIIVTSKQMPEDTGSLEECIRKFPRASADVQVLII